MQSRNLGKAWKLKPFKNKEIENISVSGNFRCNNLGLISYFSEQVFGIAKLTNVTANASVNHGRLKQVLPEWGIALLDITFITSTTINRASVRVLW